MKPNFFLNSLVSCAKIEVNLLNNQNMTDSIPRGAEGNAMIDNAVDELTKARAALYKTDTRSSGYKAYLTSMINFLNEVK